jgi:phosphoribosyl 1,2-cyclic phosphate phosphodiesterase
MKVTLLGTGGSAGLPQIGGPDGHGDWGDADPKEPRNARTRSSIVLETAGNKRLLVDTAPDLRFQLTGCGIGRVDALLYTHSHADHVAGLDDIRILNRIQNAPMPAYGTAETLAELRSRFGYAFRPHTGGFFARPALVPNIIIPGQCADILGESVTFIDQDHGFTRSLGFRVGNFAYCTDVVRMDEATFAVLKDLDVLVAGCFTLAKEHPSHAGLPTVLAWANRLQPKRLILTHMGPDMDYRTLLNTLPTGVEPGYDGMVIDVV